MKFSLVIILLTIFSAKASPPIDGGIPASLSTDYIDMVKIENGYNGNCSGSFVKINLILTAAHCVLKFENGTFTQILKKGSYIGGLAGHALEVTFHPNYKEAVLGKYNAKTQDQKDKFSNQSILYDVAFIEIKKRESKRTLPYPQIINKDSKLENRGKIELAGFGVTRVNYQDGWKFSGESNSLRVAQNEWVTCPQNFFQDDIKKIESLMKETTEALKIRATRYYEINSDGSQYEEKDGKGMVLVGDSGSPSLERDQDGNLVITGVASSVSLFDKGSGSPEISVYKDEEVIFRKEISNMTFDWMEKSKSTDSFPEVKKILSENGYLESDGSLKAGLSLTRSYKVINRGNFSDLSIPTNQKFIESVFKKTP